MENSKVRITTLLIAVVLLFSSCNYLIVNMLFDLDADYVLTGNLDLSFDPGSGANGNISSIAFQDSKIIIAGNFTEYNGTAINRIARLNQDGSLDTSFSPGTGFDSYVHSIVVQSDGKIVAGGNFTSFNGTARTRIARLNAGGSLDTTFDPGSGADSMVQVVRLQGDKLLLGGGFSNYNGTAVGKFIRISADGALDTSFNSGTSVPGGDVQDINIDPNNKIMITGNFSQYNGTTRNYIARLHSDGSLDTSFDPAAGPNNATESIYCHSDGTYTVSGLFTAYAGTTRNFIAQVNSDGSLNADFAPSPGAANAVYPVTEVAEEKLLIAGNFATFNGHAYNNIVRLNRDGSVDTKFNPGSGASGIVQCIRQQSDGKVLISGAFTDYNGVTRNRIARIE